MKPGKIVLMGSGELGTTMVEVHKELLKPYGPKGKAVFLDTPAGFQLNADLISRKAEAYFTTHLQHPLAVASFKSAENITPSHIRQLLHILQDADFILIGPGSPTYALKQWQSSPIPRLLLERLNAGACLVAASAAALAIGHLTLPVYEIYKVGEKTHWVKGLDILGPFGLCLAVVPHWNNSEGGNHDTRFCFMGEQRLFDLEKQLPEEVSILGIDEHTALVMDLEQRQAAVRGRGTATLRHGGQVDVLDPTRQYAFSHLGPALHPEKSNRLQPSKRSEGSAQVRAPQPTTEERMAELARQLIQDAAPGHAEADTRALLDFESEIWRSFPNDFNADDIVATHNILRQALIACSQKLDERPISWEACVSPLVKEILTLRDQSRKRQNWQMADALRDCLQRAKVIVTDTAEGTRWHQQ